MKLKSGAGSWKRHLWLGAAVVCFLLFFLSNGESHRVPDTGGRITEWRVGLPFSPWWRYYKRTSANGSFESEYGLQVRSWSWLILLAGAMSLAARRRLKPLEAPQI